jgi:hypothetical protein
MELTNLIEKLSNLSIQELEQVYESVPPPEYPIVLTIRYYKMSDSEREIIKEALNKENIYYRLFIDIDFHLECIDLYQTSLGNDVHIHPALIETSQKIIDITHKLGLFCYCKIQYCKKGDVIFKHYSGHSSKMVKDVTCASYDNQQYFVR